MFKVLIIDDTPKQIEKIKANLLKMNNLDDVLKKRITEEHLSITHFYKPSEAEDYIRRVAGRITAPDFIICDVNFEGLEKDSDNGRFRGLELTKYIVDKMPNVPIILLTLYSTGEIQGELRKLMPIRVLTRWVYDFHKQGVLDGEWTTRFTDIFQFIVQNNIDDISLSERTKAAIYHTIHNRQPIAQLFQNNDLEATYKNRIFSLKSLFVAWLKFEQAPNANDFTIKTENELTDLLKELVAIPNEDKALIFEQLISDYHKTDRHENWVVEIQNAVSVAVKTFMKQDWGDSEQVQTIQFDDNKKRTFFSIGNFLDMKRLPIYNNSYDITNPVIQGRIINWLKARLFVLTIYKLFQDEKYQTLIAQKNHGTYQKTNPFDFAIMAGLRNEVSNYNIHTVNNGKKETIKQYFYTFLKLKGNLRCQTNNIDELPKDKLDDTCLLPEEIKWLSQDLSYLLK